MNDLKEILEAITWLQWAMLAILLLAAVLCIYAGIDPVEKEIPRRPMPLPKKRPENLQEYVPQHSIDAPTRRNLAPVFDHKPKPPPPGRIHWLASDESQGFWIWKQDQ